MVELRRVRPGEAGALGRLTVVAYEALGRPLEHGYDLELADIDRRSREATVLVAVGDGGRLLGGVTLVDDPSSPWAEFTDPDEAGIRMLAVDPAAQGQGVGEALVRACIERARAGGKRRLSLHSTPWMTTAHRLYERLGFQRDPGRDWAPVPDIPLVGFVLSL